MSNDSKVTSTELTPISFAFPCSFTYRSLSYICCFHHVVIIMLQLTNNLKQTLSFTASCSNSIAISWWLQHYEWYCDHRNNEICHNYIPNVQIGIVNIMCLKKCPWTRHDCCVWQHQVGKTMQNIDNILWCLSKTCCEQFVTALFPYSIASSQVVSIVVEIPVLLTYWCKWFFCGRTTLLAHKQSFILSACFLPRLTRLTVFAE